MRMLRSALVALLFCAPLCACGERRAVTPREVKLLYAQALTGERGVQSGMTVVRAGSYDPETLVLRDVQIEGSERLIAAERGVIVVDAASNRAAIRLEGVVGADVENGKVVSLDDFTTPSIKIGKAVRDQR